VTNSSEISTVLVDAHVHIHRCFDPKRFFDQAYDNFRSAARSLASSDRFVGVAMLAETPHQNYFTNFRDMALGKGSSRKWGSCNWSFDPTEEQVALKATNCKRELVVIAGRQVVAAEDIEVLLLGTDQSLQDGLPIATILDLAADQDLLSVIPWGAGKWLFRRGRVLTKLMDSLRPIPFYLGDQGGRPNFWRLPHHLGRAYQENLPIVSGSDALPFAAEAGRIGSFGFCFNGSIDQAKPSESIKAYLRKNGADCRIFGRLQGTAAFLGNQLRMQFLKRVARKGNPDYEQSSSGSGGRSDPTALQTRSGSAHSG
jgi:hypothetical protein